MQGSWELSLDWDSKAANVTSELVAVSCVALLLSHLWTSPECPAPESLENKLPLAFEEIVSL